MQQQNMLAQKGQVYHYRIDQALRWMLDRFEDGRIVAKGGDHDALLGIRTAIGKMPNKTACVAVATQAVKFIHSYRDQLRGTEYSDMYAVLDSALADLGTSARTILRSQ